MSVRDWDAAVREAQGEPIEFTLGGQHFAVPCPIPAAVFLSFADHQADGAQLTAGFRDLIRDMLEVSQRPLLETAIRDSGISGQLLVDLAQWLIEEATARPTERRSGSPGSVSTNGAATSAAASPRRAGSRRPRTASG